MDNRNEAISKLKSLTGKRYIYFFDSGDDAIFWVMNHLKDRGFKKILIPGSGGWFSYRKYPKKLGLDVIEIKTIDSLIDVEDLKQKIEADAFVLINSIGGYFVAEPMIEIVGLCKHKFSILVNDVSASLGNDLAKFGDFCVGSFGEYKPIELGIGGFVGSDTELIIEKCDFENDDNMQMLNNELDRLQEKLSYWKSVREKILVELSGYDILHKDSMGINVVIAYDIDEEKENLINYCDKHYLEYVLCPNYIKLDRQAISIELKRVKYKK